MAAARSQSEREETFEVGLKAITEICPIAGLPSLDYGSHGKVEFVTVEENIAEIPSPRQHK